MCRSAQAYGCSKLFKSKCAVNFKGLEKSGSFFVDVLPIIDMDFLSIMKETAQETKEWFMERGEMEDEKYKI